MRFGKRQKKQYIKINQYELSEFRYLEVVTMKDEERQTEKRRKEDIE